MKFKRLIIMIAVPEKCYIAFQNLKKCWKMIYIRAYFMMVFNIGIFYHYFLPEIFAFKNLQKKNPTVVFINFNTFY